MPGVTPSGQGVNPIYPQWETDFLNGLGAPLTSPNYQALTLWASSEGTTGSNNPLAISGHHPGSTHCIAQCGSSSEIMAYDTMANGVAANVAFLQGSYYVGVVSAFQKNAGLNAIWAAVNQSPWCTGCQGGKYPIAIYNAIPNPTGAVGQALAGVQAGVDAVGGAAGTVAGAVVNAIPGVSTVSSVGGLIKDVTSPDFWKRIGMGAFGVGLFVVGMVVFFEGTDTGQKVTSSAVSGAAMAAVA